MQASSCCARCQTRTAGLLLSIQQLLLKHRKKQAIRTLTCSSSLHPGTQQGCANQAVTSCCPKHILQNCNQMVLEPSIDAIHTHHSQKAQASTCTLDFRRATKPIGSSALTPKPQLPTPVKPQSNQQVHSNGPCRNCSCNCNRRPLTLLLQECHTSLSCTPASVDCVTTCVTTTATAA